MKPLTNEEENVENQPPTSPKRAIPTPTAIPLATPQSVAPPKAKKRIANNAQPSIDSAIDEVNKLLAKDNEDDEAHSVGMAIAAKLRKFDEPKFALARKEIENLLYRIQYPSEFANNQSFSSNYPTFFNDYQPTYTHL